MASTLKPPTFANDTEESEWWYDNRHLVDAEFLKAFEEGSVRRSTLMRRALAAETTVQLDPEDASKALAAANRKGMPFQTYLKMLIHEALERDEQTAA
jgi:predicted DNA binding CopG/RHH family protein